MSDNITVTRIEPRGSGYRCTVTICIAGEVITIPNIVAYPRRAGWHVSAPHSIALSRGLRDRVHATVAAALVSVDGGARHGDAA
jgi:hypothetical protein